VRVGHRAGASGRAVDDRDDTQGFTVNAMKSAFIPSHEWAAV